MFLATYRQHYAEFWLNRYVFHCNWSEHPATVDNPTSPVPIENGTCEESEAAPAGISEQPATPTPQDAMNPPQKVERKKCCKVLSKLEMFCDQTRSNKVQTRKCLIAKQFLIMFDHQHFPFEQGFVTSFSCRTPMKSSLICFNSQYITQVWFPER